MKKTVLLISLLTISFISIRAQVATVTNDTIRESAVNLFIDCRNCDMNHIRREIPYVNFVRDINDAQLYLRETSQNTGSGGREFSYFFTGMDKFKGLNDTLVYISSPDDTNETRRQGRTDMIKMGLMRYVARTPIYKELKISHTGIQKEEEIIDNWKNWIFEVETRPRINIEETVKEYTFRNTFNATKITEDWKFEFDFVHTFNRTKYIYDDSTNIADKKEIRFNQLIVKSLGEHWSAGLKTEIQASTFNNYKFLIKSLPAVEYNLFPYSESTHHQLRILYGIGPSLNHYIDSTIYDKTYENLMMHQLQIAYRVQEKWGSINLSSEFSNYLNDFSKNRFEVDGNINIRIIKGLSFSVRGSAAKINDQLSLVKDANKSEADILLKLKELATEYQIEGSLGLTYTFGSIYNNIVNPRFGNGR